jgi:hypothetical protein
MTTTSALYDSLVNIVGKDFVSDQKEERYFYARDGGLMPPHEPDFVVMPKTTEEVQEIGGRFGIDRSGYPSTRRHCAGYESDGQNSGGKRKSQIRRR